MNKASSPIPVYLDDGIQAPKVGRCLVCERPLGAKQHDITALPGGEHLSCRNRRSFQNSFPWEEQLDSLRKLAVLFQRQYRQIVETGRWLASVKRGWPGTRDAFEMDRRAKLSKLQSGLDLVCHELALMEPIVLSRNLTDQ